jgi:hypothetical protein
VISKVGRQLATKQKIARLLLKLNRHLMAQLAAKRSKAANQYSIDCAIITVERQLNHVNCCQIGQYWCSRNQLEVQCQQPDMQQSSIETQILSSSFRQGGHINGSILGFHYAADHLLFRCCSHQAALYSKAPTRVAIFTCASSHKNDVPQPIFVAGRFHIRQVIYGNCSARKQCRLHRK